MKTVTITTYAAALAALMLATSANAADPATGCLKRNGQLIQFKLGNKPLRSCPRNTKKVSLSVHEGNQVTRFHEVLRFGETLTITDRPDGRFEQYIIEGGCGSSAKRRGIGLEIYYVPAVMSIHDNGETVISGITEGRISAGYDLPHMYEMAAKNGVVDLIGSNGNRLRVEATLVVNHVGCTVSGTAELFTR